MCLPLLREAEMILLLTSEEEGTPWLDVSLAMVIIEFSSCCCGGFTSRGCRISSSRSNAMNTSLTKPDSLFSSKAPRGSSSQPMLSSHSSVESGDGNCSTPTFRVSRTRTDTTGNRNEVRTLFLFWLSLFSVKFNNYLGQLQIL